MKTARRDETRERPQWWPIALIAIVAIVVRLIIAYAVLPADAGYATDLQSFRYWAAELGANGPWGFYGRGFFVDYLPGYLALLWPLGALAGAVTGSTDPGVLIKLPAIFADGLLVVATARLAHDLGASRRAEAVAAATIALLPATWIDSAVWGQVDAVGTCLLLFATSALIRGQNVRAAVLTALAAVVKPQFGIIIPIIAALVWVRARTTRDPWRFVVAGLAGAATVSLVAAPFGQTLFDVAQRVVIAGGGYQYLSVGAWNPWALVSIEGVGLAQNGGWASDVIALPALGVPGVAVGAVAMVAAIALAVRRARADRAATTVAAIAFVAVSFFVLPTRVHERYLFAAIPLATALAASNRRWLPIAATANLLFAANAWSALTKEYLNNPGLPDLGPLATALQSHEAVVIGSLASIVLLAASAAAALGTRQQSGKGSGAAVKIPYLVGAEPRSMRLRESGAEASRRRLDRTDLWLLLVIAVTALALRGWRVGEPSRFHFDEVYHVRTATEFLQDWRYGEPHAIYEYTHPHLAKYAIAIGVDTVGAPRVNARSDYGTPILAVASRGVDAAGPGLIWIATSSGVDVIESSTRALRGTIAVPSVVAMRPDSTGGLWGATATGGIFHAAPDGAASGTPTPIVYPGIAPNVVAVAPLDDGALIVATSSELLRVESGRVVARRSIASPVDVLVVTIGDTQRIVASGATGLTLFSTELTGDASSLQIDGGAGDLIAVDWTGESHVYAATPREIVVVAVRATGVPTRSAAVSIPGATALLAEPATRMIHAVAPGPSGAGRSLWSIEPNGNARFADVALGPTSKDLGGAGIALDASAGLPDGGRGDLIVASGDGAMVQVAVGELPAGWRWPGVLAGALAAALLALLARLLTERRDVAALVGALALLDGAAFVQSRIGMNDVYLLATLLGACCAFVAWMQGRATGAFAAGGLLATSGVLLGAALASKWVALYGVAGLGLIWLGRSAGGRLLAVAGLIALSALLVPQALAAGDGAVRPPNLPFAAIAFAIVAAAAASAYRAGGIDRSAFSTRGILSATRFSAEGLLLLVAFVAVPLGVYLASYLPWIALGNHFIANPSSATEGGQSLVELTASMYRYHDTLRVAHAASSPWWAWPLDLKPVWFFQGDYNGMSGAWSGAIYDGGNVLSRLLSIAGVIWVGVIAWRRRSGAYASLIILYLAMWLPWARIDRAAFQYHYYPAAQLALIPLGILLAEVRSGDGHAARYLRRAGAAAVLFAPLAWSLTGALCAVAGVASVNPQSQVCVSGGFGTPGPAIGAIALVPATLLAWMILGARNPTRIFAGAIVAIAAVAVLWYPNWSALPLPSGAYNWYQGLLPTWIWAFQFGVTLAKPVSVPLIGGATAIQAIALCVVAVVAAGMVAAIERKRIVELDEERA
mgnify:CR=1 FL=1